MSMKIKFIMQKFLIGFGLVIVLLGFVQSANAQQTIINVPSSDVLPAGDVILKGSTRIRLNDDDISRFSPSVIMGIGRGMDFSFAVPTSIDKNFNTTVDGDIGAKKVWFLGHSTRLTAGAAISPSFNMPVTPDTFSYVHLTQKIKKTKTSLTFGGYMSGQSHFLNVGGVIVGFDQVLISNKLRVVCDWMSGDNNRGNFAVGVKYRPIPSLSVTGAVILPNKNTESVAFNVSISKYISIDDENPIKRRLLNVD